MAWGAKAGVADWTRRFKDNDAALSSLLVMRSRKMTEEDWVELCASLHGNTALKELKASGHALSPTAAAAFGAMLAKNSGLKTLAVGDETFGDAGLSALSQGLGENAALQELELDLKGAGAEGAKALAGALSTNTGLRKLTLARNKLGDAGVVALCEGLASSGRQGLEVLDLSETEMEDAGAAAVAALLASPNCALSTLVLCQNTLSETGCAALWNALKTAAANKAANEDTAANEDSKAANQGRALTSLSLDGCPGALGGAAVEAMKEALAGSPALLHLSIQGAECPESSRASAAVALGSCTSLLKLKLNSTALGDEGMAALASGLVARALADKAAGGGGAPMEVLDVSENGVTATGAASLLLCPALSSKHVSLFGNSIAEGASALALSLREGAAGGEAVGPGVQDVDLGGNSLQEEGSMALLAVFRDCPNLFPDLLTLGFGGNEGLNDKDEPEGELKQLLDDLQSRPVPLEVVYRTSMADKPEV